uniref:hypothetical protein n=1 Tax=Prevotella sp. TaxID=59823 RepID=UPI004026AE7E
MNLTSCQTSLIGILGFIDRASHFATPLLQLISKPPLATVNDLFSVCMGTKLRAYKLWKDVEKCVVLALCE